MITTVKHLNELLQGLSLGLEDIKNKISDILSGGLDKSDLENLRSFYKEFNEETVVFSAGLENSLEIMTEVAAELGYFQEDLEIELKEKELSPNDEKDLEILKEMGFESPTFISDKEDVMESYKDLISSFEAWKKILEDSSKEVKQISKGRLEESIENAADSAVTLENMLDKTKKLDVKIEIFIRELE